MKVHGTSFSVDQNALKATEANNKAKTVQVFSQKIQDKLNDTLYHPQTHVYYGYQPPNATAGEISWLFSGNDLTTGTAYEFDGYNWKPVPDSNKQIFGSQIYGVDIHGASITGGVFKSEKNSGADGKSSFFVDTEGKIYAQNYYMDILTPYDTTLSSMNKRLYRGEYSPNDTERMGFNIDNGILQMHASASQLNNNIPDYTNNNFFATTYLEPDYLKLRNTTDQYGSYLNVRTDIRSGIISLGREWNETYGTKITDKNIFITDYSYRSMLTSQGLWTTKLNVGVTPGGGYGMIGTNDGNSLQFANGTIPTDINFGYGFAHSGISAPLVNGQVINASTLNKNSDLSIKNNIQDVDKSEILSKINATDIKSYQYKYNNNKDKTNIGPIIDDENKDKKYYTPHELINHDYNKSGNDAIVLDNAIAFSFAGIQQLSKEKNDLELRVAKLERKLNQQ